MDTRSDIYSLGVLLYELLTGTPPLDEERLRRVGYDELRRLIREEEPPKPSTRISTLGAAAVTVSANRRSDPKQLSRFLRGELDWIVLKALEKDRSRRYETASAFAADVQRYLHDEPVEACPPSALYRFRKFARRNKTALRMAVVVAVALLLAVTSLAVSTTLTWRANRDLQQTLERERQNAYYQRIALAEREWSANNLGQMQLLLADCPEDIRGWEWYYLARLPRGELPSLRYSGALLHVALSPDGQRIAAAGRDSFVAIWDRQTGRKLVPSFKASERVATCVEFSPDGRLLATGGGEDGTVMLWAAETGQLLRKLEGQAAVFKVAFSPDGQRLVSVGSVRMSVEGEARGGMTIWDVATGHRLFTVLGHDGPMTCLAFSPDGKRLAIGGGDSTVTIWNAQTGEGLRTFHGHNQAVQCVAFSPDGRLLASGGGNVFYPSQQTVKIWDGETGQELCTLRGHLGTIFGVAFGPDGRRLASASWDRTVKLWEVATGKEILTLRGHLDVVRSLVFSRDGHRLVSASADGTVRVWDAAPVTAEDPHCLSLPEAGGVVTSVAFHPNHQRIVAAAYGDGKVRVWDVSSGKPDCVHTLAVGDDKGVYALAFSRAGQWLAAVAVNELKVWNATTYQEFRTIPGDPGFFCVAFRPDEHQVAAAGFQNLRRHFPIRLWEVANTKEPAVLYGNNWVVCQIAFSPDGRQLASAGNDGTVRIWDLQTGKRIDTPALTPTVPTYALAFSPDGRLLALGSNDHGVRVWDTATWTPLHEYRDAGAVRSVAFSADGKRLAWGSTDSTAKVCDLPAEWARGGNPVIHTLRGHTSWVLSVAFSRDGQQIASASADGTVKIWQAPPLAGPPAAEARSQNP